jgi:hypothetical protein
MVTLRRARNKMIITLGGNGAIKFQGLLVSIGIEATGALAAVSVGTTPEGNEILDSEAVAEGGKETYNIGVQFSNSTTLYITGITSRAKITLYKL